MINFFKAFKNFKIPFFTPLTVYFDMGTSYTKIGVKDKGIVLKEPTYLGYNTKNRDYIFFGQEAKNIVGKTPEFLKIIRPMINGIISDFDAQVELIKRFIEKSVYPYFHQYKIIKPIIKSVAAYPIISTEIEQKAIEEVLLKAGCSQVLLVEKPLATAAGCGFDVFSHKPHLIADLGGGLIEISIISGGGIVASKTLKNAGETMNKLIANYVYLKDGVILGEATCERLKKNLLNFKNEEKVILVRGKSLETGLPKSIKIRSSDIKESLLNNFSQIIESIKELVEVSPPEIVDEVFNTGIFLTGSLAEIPGIDLFLKNELKINTQIAKDFDDVTINGLIILNK